MKGHTLMELILVILIIGVLVVVMVPAIGSQSSHKLRGAAEKMASDIRYAQQLAISSGRWVRIDFPPALLVLEGYELSYCSANSATGCDNSPTPPEGRVLDTIKPGTEAALPGLSRHFIVDYGNPPSAGAGYWSPFVGVDLVSSNFPAAASNEDLVFDPTGVPYAYLSGATNGAGVVVISYGGSNRCIEVSPMTGAVRVRDPAVACP